MQWLRDRSRTVTAVDLDPMSHSLAEYKCLSGRTLDLLHGTDMEFNGPAMDQLAEDMLIGDGDWVLDNGSAGFLELTRFLVDNEFPDMLKGYNGRLVVHAVLAGGSAALQCLIGLDTLLQAFGDGVQFVLWDNPYEDAFRVDGMKLQDMKVYTANQSRIAGLIQLPRMSKHFLADFRAMRDERLIFSEALASPKFHLLNQQRLKMIQRGLWSQLDGLGLV